MSPRRPTELLRRAVRGPAFPWSVAAVAVAGLVTFAVLWQGQRSEAVRRDEVEETTRRFAEALTNFSAETIERDVAEIRSYAVGGFADEVNETFGPDRVEAIRESEAQSVGRVQEVFVQSVEGPSASAFAVVEETVVNQTQATPRTDVLRMEVGLIRTEDGWKVDSVEILQSPGG